MNFAKLHIRNNLKCVFGCINNEDKENSFVTFVMKTFEKFQKLRNHVIKNHHLHGGATCQDLCTFGDTLNCAADIYDQCVIAMYLLLI